MRVNTFHVLQRAWNKSVTTELQAKPTQYHLIPFTTLPYHLLFATL